MELEKINTEILAFNALKEKALALGNKCKSIVVNSPETLTLALQTLGEANDIAKFIEDRRKAIKAPVLDIGKQIDTKAKELTALLDPGLIAGKQQVKLWNDAQEAIRQKALKDAQDKIDAAKKLDDERKQKIKDYLAGIQKDIADKTISCETETSCDKLKASVEANFPDAKLFHEFEQVAIDLKAECLKMIDVRKSFLAVKGNLSASEAQSIEVGLNEGIQAGSSAIAESVSEVVSGPSQAMVDATASQQSLEAGKAKGMRKTWKWEVADLNFVPKEWMCIDEKKVSEYLSQNKEMLTDGVVINGIKFYQDSSVVIK